MENDYLHFDLETLRKMYEQGSSDLNRLLLNGAQWHEVRELKHRVVQLSIAMHKRIRETSPGTDAPAAQTPGTE